MQAINEQGQWKDIAGYNLLKRVGHSNVGTTNQLKGIWELQKIDNKEFEKSFRLREKFLLFNFTLTID